MTFGEWLKAQRSAQCMTQKMLAERLNVSTVHLSRLENSRDQPSPKLLRNALLVFDVTGGDFDNLFEQFRGEKTDRKFRDLEQRVRKLESLVYRLTGEMPT